jgi:hypothetical protein
MVQILGRGEKIEQEVPRAVPELELSGVGLQQDNGSSMISADFRLLVAP